MSIMGLQGTGNPQESTTNNADCQYFIPQKADKGIEDVLKLQKNKRYLVRYRFNFDTF